MLAEDLQADNLYTIASNTPPTAQLLAEIQEHPACYPKLKAWASYVQATGEATPVPAPPVAGAQALEVEEEVKPVVEAKASRARLFGAKKPSPGYAPLPAKNRRNLFLALGGVVGVAALIGGVVFLQSHRSTPEPAQAAPSNKVEVPAVSGLTASGDGFVCEANGNKVECFGQNHLGQLGAGMASKEHKGEIKLEGPVKQLVAGADFACASTGKGVTCWGDNRWRMVGDTDTQILPPTPLGFFVGKPVDSLAAGELHACVVSEKKLYCWGSGFSGQLADGQEGPKASGVKEIPLPEGQTPKSVVSSRFGSCVETTKAKLYCWGSNEGARIAEGESQYLGLTDMDNPTPVTSEATPETQNPAPEDQASEG